MTNLSENVFLSPAELFTLSTEKNVFCWDALGPRVEIAKQGGLFNKTRSEGVSSFIGPRSSIGRLPIHPEALRPAGRRKQELTRRCAMNAAVQLAGASHLRDSVHQNSHRAHGRVEESVAISPRP